MTRQTASIHLAWRERGGDGPGDRNAAVAEASSCFRGPLEGSRFADRQRTPCAPIGNRRWFPMTSRVDPGDFANEFHLNADLTSANCRFHSESARKLPPRRSTNYPARPASNLRALVHHSHNNRGGDRANRPARHSPRRPGFTSDIGSSLGCTLSGRTRWPTILASGLKSRSPGHSRERRIPQGTSS